MPVERRRLPAAPLLQAVSAYATRRQQLIEELVDDALRDRLRDAARSRAVTVGTAERCCDANTHCATARRGRGHQRDPPR